MKKLLMLAAGLAVGATASGSPVEEQTVEKDACAFLTQIGGVRALDSRTAVILSSTGKPAYVVTLGTPLPELKYAIRYAYIDRDRDGRLCGRSRDAIAVPGEAVGPPARIMAMTPLDPTKIRALEEKYQVTLTKKNKSNDEPPKSDDQADRATS